jgi:hypothetical protein
MMASYPFWYHDFQGRRGEELNALTHLSLRGRSRKYEWNPLVVTTNGFYSPILTTESGVEKVQVESIGSHYKWILLLLSRHLTQSQQLAVPLVRQPP